VKKRSARQPATDENEEGDHRRGPGKEACRGDPGVVRYFETRTLTPFAVYCLIAGAVSFVRFAAS
jgi:hypothetical protein